MKRILFCSPVPLDLRFGMTRHWNELADCFRARGWAVDVVGPNEIAGGPISVTPETFPKVLRDFLRRTAAGYNVVEYDHVYLPYPRTDFPSGPLFVARCMLLHHHFLIKQIPPAPGLLRWVRHTLDARRRRRWLEEVVSQTDATVRQADVTVVCNDRDAIALAGNGADPDRIAVLPVGMTAGRFRRFAAIPDWVPARPVIGFIGTFDPRKGMREFPDIVDQLARHVPDVTVRLLGTAGMVRDADGVRRCFPRRLWPRLEIHPRYDPNELPALLADVSIGVFPSRVEGSPYGVLEMLAAAIPVIAYDAPGPHAMVRPDFLVPVGDTLGLASRVINLIADPVELRSAQSVGSEPGPGLQLGKDR